MIRRAGSDGGLLARLVSDAEARAGEGRVRESLLLLRWASRICPDGSLPVVLLAFRRVRPPRHALDVAPPAFASAPAVPVENGGVHSDGLGFPVPRFPTAPPTIDHTAFVAAPRGRRVRTAAHPERAPSAMRPARRRSVLAPLIVLASAAAVAAPRAELLLARLRPVDGESAPGAAAMRSGDPRRALVETAEGTRSSAVLLVRGRAFLALGDTASGLVALDSAWAQPLASAEDAREAAVELAGIAGAERRAADAYMRAFEGGMPKEHWRAAADALERAGRPEQAQRLRSLAPLQQL